MPRDVPRFGNRIDAEQLINYQVHIDIDGNTNSWDGLRWRLMFGMMVVKARSSNGFVQWYYPHLQNGVNIIEVPVDDVSKTARAILDDVNRGAKITSISHSLKWSVLWWRRCATHGGEVMMIGPSGVFPPARQMRPKGDNAVLGAVFDARCGEGNSTRGVLMLSFAKIRLPDKWHFYFIFSNFCIQR